MSMLYQKQDKDNPTLTELSVGSSFDTLKIDDGEEGVVLITSSSKRDFHVRSILVGPDSTDFDVTIEANISGTHSSPVWGRVRKVSRTAADLDIYLFPDPLENWFFIFRNHLRVTIKNNSGVNDKIFYFQSDISEGSEIMGRKF